MDEEMLKSALEKGNTESNVLYRVLKELAEDFHCPRAEGFEGPGTFSDCGECIYCLAWKLHTEGLV